MNRVEQAKAELTAELDKLVRYLEKQDRDIKQRRPVDKAGALPRLTESRNGVQSRPKHEVPAVARSKRFIRSLFEGLFRSRMK